MQALEETAVMNHTAYAPLKCQVCGSGAGQGGAGAVEGLLAEQTQMWQRGSEEVMERL